MKKLPFIFLLFCLFSCSRTPDNVKDTLASAGTNREELEKVITHFKKLKDPEKLEAAYFLIGNMKNKYSYDGPIVRNFDTMFDILDSLRVNKVQFKRIQSRWDSLVNIYGFPTRKKAIRLKDAEHIKSEYLIGHIDQAFKIWKETSQKTKLDFKGFCTYILPYRLGNERLEQWQKNLYTEYKTFRDTVKGKSNFDYVKALNYHLRVQKFTTDHTIWAYPFSLPASVMGKGRLGACQHVVAYTAMAMRANGFPIGIDKTATWGNRGMGHFWCTLLMENGKLLPFDGAKGPLEGHKMFIYKFAKVQREAFKYADIEFPDNTTDVPASVVDIGSIDVTHEYTKTYDITVPLKFPPQKKKKYALICTFDNRNWVPQDWGKIEGDEVKFKNMGSDILYLAMYFHKGVYYPANDPFILTKTGKIRYILSGGSKKQEMTLLRKYPIFETQVKHLSRVLGGRFQGANQADFSDSINLFTIKQMPQKLEEITIDYPKAFRYVRYVAPGKNMAVIAELEFYTNDKDSPTKLKGKILGPPLQTEYPHENAFDGKLDTYYHSGSNKPYSWIGLDLLKPKRITKIRYCPINDTNFIIAGDTYQLSYWDKDRWKSFEKKVATDQVVNYNNVPANRLYLLRDLAGGKENRIFTYENGKQVWW